MLFKTLQLLLVQKMCSRRDGTDYAFSTAVLPLKIFLFHMRHHVISILSVFVVPRLRQQEHLFSQVKYINLSISTLGVLDQPSLGLLDMLKDLNYNSSTTNYILRKITTVAIRTTYYIFCRRNKDWNNPGLLIL